MLPNARLVDQLQRITDKSFYSDKAYILRKVDSGTFDAYNHPIQTVSEIQIDCSFTDRPTRDIWKTNENLNQIEAEIRFASPEPLNSDQIKITDRFGKEVSNITYEVVGISNRGEFGYVVALKAVSV
jgi:hypothetical protein